MPTSAIYIIVLILCAIGATHTSLAGVLTPVSAAREAYSPGVAGNGFSSAPVLSADGRFVFFHSAANNLLPADEETSCGGSGLKIYVSDRTDGRTRLVSACSKAGAWPNGDSWLGDISADSRYVVFTSAASNLVPDDTNGCQDVFLRDLVRGTTTLLSVNVEGSGPGDFSSWDPVITPDGSFVVFTSGAANLVPKGSGPFCSYRRALAQQQTVLVNVPAVSPVYPYTDRSLVADRSVISANGERVAFWSYDPYYIVGLTNFHGRIYVRDLSSGTVRLASGAVAGLWNMPERQHDLSFHAMSMDGRYVVFHVLSFRKDSALLRYDFETDSTEIVSTNALPPCEGTTPPISEDGRFVVFEASVNGATRALYRWDGITKSDVLLTPNWAGTGPANGRSTRPSITPDGRFVSFVSSGTDLLAEPQNGEWQGYIRDIDLGVSYLSGVNSNSHSETETIPEPAWIAADGQHAVFSTAESLAPEDLNELEDVYLLNLQDGKTELISAATPGAPAVTGRGRSKLSAGALSANGRYAAFESTADNLVSADTNRLQDIFLRDLHLGSQVLVSVNTNGGAANGISFRPVLSADGRCIAFFSRATDLTGRDANRLPDLYVRDLAAGETVLASMGTDAMAAGVEISETPCLSADGQVAVFVSRAQGIDPDDTDFIKDIFWRNLRTGTTFRVNDSWFQSWFACSTNGHRVAYNAYRFVVLWDAILRREIFAGPIGSAGRHLSADGQTLYYSVPGSSGLELRALNMESGSEESIGILAVPTRWGSVTTSQDGRWVAYVSARGSSGLQANLSDVVLVDRYTRTRTVVTAAADQPPANGSSDLPCLSADGRFLAFRSRASNLVTDDANGASDVFLYDRSTAAISLLTRSIRGGSGRGGSSLPLISANGQTILLESVADDLVSGDYNSEPDVFLYADRSSIMVAFQSLTRAADGNVTLHWAVEAGWRYRIQSKDDLSVGSWSTVESIITVANSVAEFVVKVQSQHKFYRILAERE